MLSFRKIRGVDKGINVCIVYWYIGSMGPIEDHDTKETMLEELWVRRAPQYSQGTRILEFVKVLYICTPVICSWGNFQAVDLAF